MMNDYSIMRLILQQIGISDAEGLRRQRDVGQIAGRIAVSSSL
jgi:hypothetical protein